jgi:hypothetical protein
MFSPRVLLLDGAGAVLREVPRDAFMFHGPNLYLGLRARPDGRYLVVASDPASVGGQETHIATQTQSSGGATTGGGYFVMNFGREKTRSFTYAHSGKLIVAAKPFPKADLAVPAPPQQ